MTAREELIEVMAQAIYDDGVSHDGDEKASPESFARAALDAELAARVSVPCPTCLGTSPTIARQFSTGTPHCTECNDSGSVPGGSLLVAYAIETGMLERDAALVGAVKSRLVPVLRESVSGETP